MDIKKTESCIVENDGNNLVQGNISHDVKNYFLKSVMECIAGPVKVIIDGKSKLFESGKASVSALSGNFEMKAITCKNNLIVVDFVEQHTIPNDTDEDWVREFKKSTGEDVSFF